jgi:Uma2 family endonuclease
MATKTFPYVSVEQYLEYDRNSERPSEYISGVIIPVEDGKPWHGLIIANVIAVLKNGLSGGPCRVFSSSLRVSLDAKSSCVYPDITVVCGKLEYVDERQETVGNPKIAVEVLSPSTVNYDLGTKARWYWKVSSLTDLIFIEQDRIGIEHWHRASDGDWRRTTIEDASSTLKIDSVNIAFPVKEIYVGVELPHGGE